MSAPKTNTMPTFQLQEGQVAILMKGTRVFGQVIGLNPQSKTPTKKIARIGDTNKSTSFQPTEHTMQMELYVPGNFTEIADLLGFTIPSTTWAGTETISLNATISTYTLLIKVYDANTGTNSDVLQGTWNITGFKPSSLNITFSAEDATKATLQGEPGAIYYTPAAISV